MLYVYIFQEAGTGVLNPIDHQYIMMAYKKSKNKTENTKSLEKSRAIKGIKETKNKTVPS